jgi:hypothetical protein
MTSDPTANDPTRRDLALLDEALDTASFVDDYVRGVIGLGDGRWGGVDQRTPSWSQRLFGRSSSSKEHQLAKMMGGSYGSEQLRKAAIASRELITAVDALETAATRVVRDTHADLVSAGIHALPATLRDPDVTASSPRLREAHVTLTRSIGRMNEARTKVLLAHMRMTQSEPTGQGRPDSVE